MQRHPHREAPAADAAAEATRSRGRAGRAGSGRAAEQHPVWYANAVAALVVAVACALLSPARARASPRCSGGNSARSPRPAQATTAPCRSPRPARRSDDALAAAFSLVLADATADPAARGWRLAEEERGVGRYLRDAAGGGRDAMSVGTVNASAETVDAALGRAAAQAPSVVEPLREVDPAAKLHGAPTGPGRGLDAARGRRDGAHRLQTRVAREPARHGADDGGGDAGRRVPALRDVDGARGRAARRGPRAVGGARVGLPDRAARRSCKVTHVVLRRARGRARVPREPARVAADGHGAQGAGACCCGFVSDCLYKNDYCVQDPIGPTRPMSSVMTH